MGFNVFFCFKWGVRVFKRVLSFVLRVGSFLLCFSRVLR